MVSLTLQSNGYSLQSVGYSPWGVKSSLHWELSEWWLLFIFNSVEHALACSRLGGGGGGGVGLGHAPTEDFLRIYPSKVKSGVNLDQKLLD